MCTDGQTFTIKTEPLDYVDCLYDASENSDFSATAAATAAFQTSENFVGKSFVTSDPNTPDYYLRFPDIKVENLLEDENFPLLQEREELSYFEAPLDIKDELIQEERDEGPLPPISSFSGMVSIPNNLLLTPKKEEEVEVKPTPDRTLVCSVCNAEYTNVKEFVKHHR